MQTTARSKLLISLWFLLNALPLRGADLMRFLFPPPELQTITVTYDYAAFTQRHERKLLWATRISCPSHGLSLPAALPAMLTLAGPNIGRETPRPVFAIAADRLKAEVIIGEMQVVDDVDRRQLPVVESAVLDPALDYAAAVRQRARGAPKK